MIATVLAVVIMGAAALVVVAAVDLRRDRDPIGPVPRRELEHYDADGRRHDRPGS